MLTDNGDTFDLCFVGYLNPYANMIEHGGLMPINEYLDNAPELTGSLPDYALSAIDFGGKIYAFPNMQIFAQDYISAKICFRNTESLILTA